MGSPTPRRFDVKCVAVVGAGPCGLAAARYLLTQKAFDEVVVYEQNSEVGGVWNYSEQPSQTLTLRVPQESAFCPPDPPIRLDRENALFPTPMYDLLHTNIPRTLMGFSDLPFPENSLIFPPRELVQDYLIKYSEPIRHLIRFRTQVTDVRFRKDNHGRDRWDVSVQSVLTNHSTTSTYGAVVVASGHYATAYLPAIKGLQTFHAAHPGVITHSKFYRNPVPHTNKKVLVVGNAASGLDIAAQISRVCQAPLLLSVRKPTSPKYLAHIGGEEVPEVVEFVAQDGSIRFANGHLQRGIDAVIFATGYLFTFPFVAPSFRLVTNGRKVHGLYRDLVHIEHPTLAFPGLPIKVVPFPMAEAQAAYVSRVWANALALPSQEQMKQAAEEDAGKRGPAFHVFPELGDAEYINSIHNLIVRSGSPGKMPPRWGKKLIWQRQICAEAKLKFEVDGRTARSLVELGFAYKPAAEDTVVRPTL